MLERHRLQRRWVDTLVPEKNLHINSFRPLIVLAPAKTFSALICPGTQDFLLYVWKPSPLSNFRRMKFCSRFRANFFTKALLFHKRPTFGTVNGSNDILHRRPRKTDVANKIGDVPRFVELDSNSSTIGWHLVMNCLVCVTRTPDTASKVRSALVL